MIIAKQSTAIIVTVGPVLDADGAAVTDGVVGDFKISKNGGAPAALNGSATLTHRHTGFYSLSLTTSDVDTVGTAEITIDDTVNSCAMKEIQVVEGAVYDAIYANAAVGYVANQPVDVNTIKTQTVTCSAGVTVSPFVGSTGAAVNGTNANTLSSHDPGETIMGATDLGTGAGLTSLATQASVDTIDNLLDTEIGALTTELAKVPKSDSNVTWNATALDSIQSEANDAIVANHLDHLLATTYDPASKPGAADALLNELVENDGGVARLTANALEEAPTGGSAPTVGEIADEVALELGDGSAFTALASAINLSVIDSGVSNINSNLNELLGDWQDGGRLDLILDARASQASLDTIDNYVDTEVAAIITTLGTPSNLGSGATIAANLADIESQTDDIGAAGAGLTAADDAILAAIAALNNITAASVWAVATRTLTAIDEDSTTLDLDATIQAAVGLAAANLDQQLADIPTVSEFNARTLAAADYATASALDAVDNYLDTELAALTSTVGSLWTTAITESYGADGAAVTPAQALYEIMQSIGERSISSTTATVKKRDGSTTAFTQTLNDASTPTAITRS